jgi:hypothetical protein
VVIRVNRRLKITVALVKASIAARTGNGEAKVLEEAKRMAF